MGNKEYYPNNRKPTELVGIKEETKMARKIRAFAPLTSSKLLEAAFQTSEWISKYEKISECGMCWDVKPGYEVPEGSLLLDNRSLYSGAAGIALFYLRLYLVTKDKNYIEKAKAGIDYVISQYKGVKEFEYIEAPMEGCKIGHLNGPTGGAYVAELLYENTGLTQYRDYAIAVTEDLISSARDVDGGLTWTGQYGIIAEGGLVLYLLYAYITFQDPRYIAAAEKAGKYIADRAEEAPGGGYRWYAMPTDTFPTLGGKPGGYFPGFFYGTAGSAYILASIAKYTDNALFLKLAKGGAEYIQNIADYSEDGKAALVRYNDPLASDLYYLGMCQGPIGISRLFYALYENTRNEEYLDFAIKLTNGILETGAPAVHTPGYWRTYSYCCGAAGMLEHFISIYRLTNDDKYLDAAYDAADTLIGESYIDEAGRRWYTAWNRHEPHTAEAFTGLYLGSAGVAASFLALYQLIENGQILPGYVENPYH